MFDVHEHSWSGMGLALRPLPWHKIMLSPNKSRTLILLLQVSLHVGVIMTSLIEMLEAVVLQKII